MKWVQYLNIIDQNARAIAIALIVLVFVTGFGYSIYLGENLRYPDEQEYYLLTQNLKHTGMFSFDGIQPTAARAPGFPFLLLVVALFSNTVLAMRLLNFFALCLSLWLLYLILRKHSRPIVGLMGVVLCIFHPVLFYTASTLYPQSVGTALFMLILFLSDRHPRWTVRSGLCIGSISGCLILTIPTFIFLIGIILAWRLIVDHDRLLVLAAMVLGLFLVIAPWAIRNYEIYHTFVFVSTNGGVNLLLGNNENTTPNAGVTVDISRYEDLVSNRQMGAAETDQFYRNQAVQWIFDHKIDAIKLYILKFINHFNFRNDLKTASEASSLRDLVAGLTYLPLLTLFLVRLISFRKFRISKYMLFLILLYISWGLIMAVFFTRVRFRLPLDFVLISIDSMFIYQVAKVARQHLMVFPKEF
ncbi:MAG: hypothetical protein PHQ40_08100 [Anaerolineaceae bacterium]|nr:hypothetical protein [Anaerolineaceae bacterium]